MKGREHFRLWRVAVLQVKDKGLGVGLFACSRRLDSQYQGPRHLCPLGTAAKHWTSGARQWQLLVIVRARPGHAGDGDGVAELKVNLTVGTFYGQRDFICATRRAHSILRHQLVERILWGRLVGRQDSLVKLLLRRVHSHDFHDGGIARAFLALRLGGILKFHVYFKNIVRRDLRLQRHIQDAVALLPMTDAALDAVRVQPRDHDRQARVIRRGRPFQIAK